MVRYLEIGTHFFFFFPKDFPHKFVPNYYVSNLSILVRKGRGDVWSDVQWEICLKAMLASRTDNSNTIASILLAPTSRTRPWGTTLKPTLGLEREGGAK